MDIWKLLFLIVFVSTLASWCAGLLSSFSGYNVPSYLKHDAGVRPRSLSEGTYYG